MARPGLAVVGSPHTRLEVVVTPTITRLLDAPAPDRLFHYTDAAGLIGILTDECFWATETSYLNDKREIEHAKNSLWQVAYSLPRNALADRYSPDEKELLDEFVERAKKSRPGVCVVSFSEEQDKLSQWRAYGGNAEHFNIGLSSAKLHECATEQGCVFGKCSYDGAAHRISIEIIEELISQYRSSDKSDLAKERLCITLEIFISQYGPLMKHSSFTEEEEWRIITPEIPAGAPIWNFRTKDGKIVPFVEVDVKEALSHRDEKDGPQVTLGPGCTLGATSFAVQNQLECTIGYGVPLSLSDTPFAPV